MKDFFYTKISYDTLLNLKKGGNDVLSYLKTRKTMIDKCTNENHTEVLLDNKKHLVFNLENISGFGIRCIYLSRDTS